ncbi:MAG: maltose alpha-D-glucosyltransferase [Desulfovibrionales bacterium]
MVQPKCISDDPYWYKDAIIYELHIKTFADSNADGVGDFKGLISKLDYLEDLGVTAIWLLPFYPSPLRDDGYDIADYRDIHPDFGTLPQFKAFLREAHARGIRVITELVINHTSDQHEWFQKARTAKEGSTARNFYVWSDTARKYEDARIIFQDFEHSNWAWDSVANAYYWHRFYYHQPDLNYDSPQVQKAVLRLLDYWFKMGVDGMRLDAIPYLYQREGTNCENLPETFAFLKKLRKHIDDNHDCKMLLAEANQWPEDAVAYFGHGDTCHMAFHFPLMPRMFMALEMEDRHPVLDILDQTPKIPELNQWALFLRNHDELTLEMVSDEERDYMYRFFAQDPRARINLGIRRRLAPLLGNDRRKIELLNVLLFSFPGSPVIYYGDEIGMGDNYYLGDRDGVRTPMQWNSDKNSGFSQANPQKLYLPVIIDPEYHYEAVNVETQERNPSSLLWWMRRLIAMRKRFKAFGRGAIEFLLPENAKVLAFLRIYEEETILVVTNLSRHSQPVSLDLSRFAGYVPEEMFSRNEFPIIRESDYTLTLASYGYYLFQLTPPERTQEEVTSEMPVLRSGSSWAELFDNRVVRRTMESEVLPEYIKRQRWFGGKARIVQQLSIVDWIQVGKSENSATILLVEVSYTEGESEIYVLPLAFARIEETVKEFPEGAVAHAEIRNGKGVLYDAVFSPKFCTDLLQMMIAKRRINTPQGKLLAVSGTYLRHLMQGEGTLEPRVLRAEQSNTSILYGGRLILKLYRRTEEGIHPDAEIIRYLTEKAGYTHIPPFAGSLEFRKAGREPMLMSLMQEFIPNQGDAWTYSLDAVGRYFDRVLTKRGEIPEAPKPPETILEAAYTEPPEVMTELVSGFFFEMTELLGRRTAELHLALASGRTVKGFKPEAFSLLYQRSVYQTMQNLARREMRLLKRVLPTLPEHIQQEAATVLDLEKDIFRVMRSILGSKIDVVKTRIHGDFHLGQVLYTGKDFVLFDFEGEPARALSERRLKRSPIRDVAGMLRSIHYVAYTSLLKHVTVRTEDIHYLDPWADLWYHHIGGSFLKGYLRTAEGASFLPQDSEKLEKMLFPYMLEKAVYELGYELNNRPEWVIIPIRGIKHLCGVKDGS